MRRLLWKFLIGYVTITLEGMYLEAFLNEIIGKYRIKSVKRPDYTRVILTVSVRYKNVILQIAERRGIRCIRIEYDAASSASTGFFRRWWISIAGMMFLICSLWLSGVCNRISFIGNEALSEFELSAMLEDHDITAGMRKKQIDLLALKNLLYKNYPSLAYAEAYFDGTELKIVLQEGREVPELSAEEPCKIVANKRGVLLSLTVGEGMAAAEPGDIVKPGQVLIRGAYTKKEHDFLVHARGSAIAQTDYIGSAEISLTSGLVRTGNTVEMRYAAIGRMKIPLTGNNPFERYETEEQTEFTVPENMPAFLRIIKKTYYECDRGVSEDMRRNAEAQIREEAYYNALKQVPDDAEILDFYSVITEKNGRLCATATVTVKEDIGTEISTGPDEIEKTEETGDI